MLKAPFSVRIVGKIMKSIFIGFKSLNPVIFNRLKKEKYHTCYNGTLYSLALDLHEDYLYLKFPSFDRSYSLSLLNWLNFLPIKLRHIYDITKSTPFYDSPLGTIKSLHFMHIIRIYQNCMNGRVWRFAVRIDLVSWMLTVA